MKLHFILLIAQLLVLSFQLSSQTNCTIPAPPVTSCNNISNFTRLMSNNTHITSNYYFSGPGTLPNGELRGNGVLILCGGTINGLSNLNINGGTLIIAPGTIVNHTNNLQITGSLFNYGTLNVNGTLSSQANHSNGGIFNTTSAVINANNLELNSRIINQGFITVNNKLDIKGSGYICAGAGSVIKTKMIYNDSRNAVVSIEGTNCLSYTTTFGGNQPISATNSTFICRSSGSNNPSNQTVGSATWMTNCTSCAIPLNNDLLSLEANQDEKGIVIDVSLDITNEMQRYAIQVASDDGIFHTVEEFVGTAGNYQHLVALDWMNTNFLFYRLIRINAANDDFDIIATKQLKITAINKFKLFPNPASSNDIITIHLPSNNSETTILEIYNMVGIKVQEEILLTGIIAHLKHLERGQYLLIQKNNEGHILQKEKLFIN